MPTSAQNEWLVNVLGVPAAAIRATPKDGAVKAAVKSAILTTATALGVATAGGSANAGAGVLPGATAPASAGAGLKAMAPDCKPVRGFVPGPAHHLLCATHKHVLDLKSKTILAPSLEDYKEAFPKAAGTSPASAHKATAKSPAASSAPPAGATAGPDPAIESKKQDMRIALKGLLSDAETALNRYTAQKHINEDHPIVSRVSDLAKVVTSFGDFFDPGPDLIKDFMALQPIVANGVAAATVGDFPKADKALAEAKPIAARMQELVRDYCEGLIDGAGASVAVLEVADKSGDVATAGLSVLSPGVGTGLSAGKKGAVAAMKVALGQKVDWDEFALDIALDLFLEKFGDAAVSKIAGGVTAKLAGKVTAPFAKEAVERVVKGLVLNEAAQVLKTAAEQTYAAARGKDVTWEQTFNLITQRLADPYGILVSMASSALSAKVKVKYKL